MTRQLAELISPGISSPLNSSASASSSDWPSYESDKSSLGALRLGGIMWNEVRLSRDSSAGVETGLGNSLKWIRNSSRFGWL